MINKYTEILTDDGSISIEQLEQRLKIGEIIQGTEASLEGISQIHGTLQEKDLEDGLKQIALTKLLQEYTVALPIMPNMKPYAKNSEITKKIDDLKKDLVSILQDYSKSHADLLNEKSDTNSEEIAFLDDNLKKKLSSYDEKIKQIAQEINSKIQKSDKSIAENINNINSELNILKNNADDLIKVVTNLSKKPESKPEKTFDEKSLKMSVLDEVKKILKKDKEALNKRLNIFAVPSGAGGGGSVTGSGTAGQVAYWNSTTAVTSSVNLLHDGTYTTATFKDTTFTLVDDADTTKKAVFELSSIASGFTRTYTFPNQSGIFVTTAASQTLTNKTLTSPTMTAPRVNDYQEFANTTAPATPTASARVYFDTSNRFSWRGTNGFTRTFDASPITNNRVWTLPDADTTLVGTDTTQTLTNKTIGITQLNSNAYTMSVNNTNATANHTTANYRDEAEATFGETITWTGTTAPSGTQTSNYRWFRVGNMVYYHFTMDWSVAGTAITSARFPMPAAMPTPQIPNGRNAANNACYEGAGGMSTSLTNTPANNSKVAIMRNAANNGFDYRVDSASVAIVTISFSGFYFT